MKLISIGTSSRGCCRADRPLRFESNLNPGSAVIQIILRSAHEMDSAKQANYSSGTLEHLTTMQKSLVMQLSKIRPSS